MNSPFSPPTCRKCYCPTVANPNQGCECECHKEFYLTQHQQIRQAIENEELYGYIKFKLDNGKMHPVVLVTATDKYVSVRSLCHSWEGVRECDRSQFYMTEMYPGQLAELHRINMRNLGLAPEAYRMHTSGG